jgi:hypothetical protein
MPIFWLVLGALGFFAFPQNAILSAILFAAIGGAFDLLLKMVLSLSGQLEALQEKITGEDDKEDLEFDRDEDES